MEPATTKPKPLLYCPSCEGKLPVRMRWGAIDVYCKWCKRSFEFVIQPSFVMEPRSPYRVPKKSKKCGGSKEPVSRDSAQPTNIPA